MLGLLALALPTFGQTPNPVPFVHQPLVPTAVAPGGPDFTLTVNGASFVPESVIQWNGSARPTTFVSNTQLTAAITASDIATIGSASITVVNPTPGGGVSNETLLLITSPIPTATFAQSDFAAKSGAVAAAAADFNGDGKSDIALQTANDIQIFLGNGDGTFQAPLSLPTDRYSGTLNVGGIVAADFSADGKIDLAVANNQSKSDPTGRGSISTFLGNGDGTFQNVADYNSSQIFPVGMVCGDFNNDGALDLAYSAYGVNGGVVFLLGRGDGTFIWGYTYRPGNFSTNNLAVGDFNGDGMLDLVVLLYDNYYGLSHLSILLAAGDGAYYWGALNLAVDGGPITAADFKGHYRRDPNSEYFMAERDPCLAHSAPCRTAEAKPRQTDA